MIVSNEKCTILKNDPILESLEISHQWKESFFYCLKKWENNQTDPESFLRILLQSWYLQNYDNQLVEEILPSGRIITHSIDEYSEICRKVFSDAYKIGERLFQDDVRYLFLIGTLMLDWPEWFLQEKDLCLEDSERRGKQRLEMFCSSSDSMQFPAIRERILGVRDIVTVDEQEQMFPGGTAINLYFQERLELWHYLDQIIQKYN